MSRSPSAITYLALTGMLLLAALLIYREHPLVTLSSDRPNNTALFATDDLGPGQSTSTTVTLTNQGLLPIEYSLGVTTPAGSAAPPAFRFHIQRASDHQVLYDGPLPRDSGPLGQLKPGQSVKLELSLSLPKGGTAQHLPLNLFFKWSGQVGSLGGWLLPAFEIFLVVSVLAILGRWFLESRGRPTASRRPSGSAAR